MSTNTMYALSIEEIANAIAVQVPLPPEDKTTIIVEGEMGSGKSSILKVLAEKPGEFDPRAYLKPAKEAMRKLCIERYQQFGCEGQASKIKPLSTAQMAKRYASGELNPQIGASARAA